ncbi:MAG TPA: hypothetical protein VIV12_22275 [Streptosporangiaceae bacterium]
MVRIDPKGWHFDAVADLAGGARQGVSVSSMGTPRWAFVTTMRDAGVDLRAGPADCAARPSR